MEVAHEALLRRPPIDGWLEEQKDALKLRDDVLREAEEWNSGGRQADALVRRGARLDSAVDLLGKLVYVAAMAPATNLEQPFFNSSPLKQTGRLMVKDENVCLHCGLCAERCPTYAWDMRRFVVELPLAGTAFIPLEAVGR